MNRYGLVLAAAFSVMLLGLAYGFSLEANAADSAVLVSIEGSSFSPEVVVVNTGGEVLWKNNDAAVHTVTADDGSFDSGALQQGDVFRRKFTSAGTIKYSCDNHSWMKGRIEIGK